MTSRTNTRSSNGVMFNSFKVLWPRREIFFIPRVESAPASTTSKSHHDAEGGKIELAGERLTPLLLAMAWRTELSQRGSPEPFFHTGLLISPEWSTETSTSATNERV